MEVLLPYISKWFLDKKSISRLLHKQIAVLKAGSKQSCSSYSTDW